MSDEAVRLSIPPQHADAVDTPPISIGARLRSTMAAEYAGPFLAEINNLKTKADEAVAARDKTYTTLNRMAARLATEHQLRLEADAQVADAREKLERTIRTFTFPAPPPARRTDRLRRIWSAITRPA
jgi:hypothetical protein